MHMSHWRALRNAPPCARCSPALCREAITEASVTGRVSLPVQFGTSGAPALGAGPGPAKPLSGEALLLQMQYLIPAQPGPASLPAPADAAGAGLPMASAAGLLAPAAGQPAPDGR